MACTDALHVAAFRKVEKQTAILSVEYDKGTKRTPIFLKRKKERMSVYIHNNLSLVWINSNYRLQNTVIHLIYNMGEFFSQTPWVTDGAFVI